MSIAVARKSAPVVPASRYSADLKSTAGRLDEQRFDHEVTFERFFRYYEKQALIQAHKILGRSGIDADDIVQEAFVSAWLGIDKLSDPQKAKSWLMGIVKNKAVDALRKSHDLPVESHDERPSRLVPEPESWIVFKEELAMVVHHINHGMTERQRLCWQLRKLDNFSYEQIAEETRLTQATVRGTLARTKQKMKPILEGSSAKFQLSL